MLISDHEERFCCVRRPLGRAQVWGLLCYGSATLEKRAGPGRRLARRVRKSDAVKVVGEDRGTPQNFPLVWGIVWGKKKGLQLF